MEKFGLGLNCVRCPLYLIPDDKTLAGGVLEWFKSNDWIDKSTTVEEFMAKGRECEGCQSAPDKHRSPDCKFNKCAAEKGIEYCFQCDDLPCEELTTLANDGAPHHAQTFRNLKRMAEIGLEEFIAEQDNPSFCPGSKIG